MSDDKPTITEQDFALAVKVANKFTIGAPERAGPYAMDMDGVSIEVERKLVHHVTIARNETVEEWRYVVYRDVYRVGTYWEPPDVDTVEESDHATFAHALCAAVHLYCETIIDQYFEGVLMAESFRAASLPMSVEQ